MVPFEKIVDEIRGDFLGVGRFGGSLPNRHPHSKIIGDAPAPRPNHFFMFRAARPALALRRLRPMNRAGGVSAAAMYIVGKINTIALNLAVIELGVSFYHGNKQK